MRHLMLFVVICLAVLVVLSSATLWAQKPLTPEQVKALKAAGFTDAQIAELVIGEKLPAAAPTAAAAAESTAADIVTVPRRTPVDIKVGELLDSSDTAVGPFKCSVDRDVKVNGIVVIAEKAPAVCRVVAIEKGTATIKRASIKVAVDSVAATDGSTVFLDYNEVHGGGGMGFGKIRPGLKIKAGTILPAVVDEKADVKLSSSLMSKTESR